MDEQQEKIIRLQRINQLCSEVNATYDNAPLIQRYKEVRDHYEITAYQKKYGRLLWEAPNYSVWLFLKLMFEPTFGKKWAFSKKVLTHEFVRPWLVVPLKEVM